MSTINEVLNQTVEVLQATNYEVFQNADLSSHSCFELLTRHRVEPGPQLLIKIIQNIDNIKPFLVNEIKLMSYLLSALPIVIGLENRRNKLEDNSIYFRKNLMAINPSTFQRIIHTPQLPLAIAKKGGHFIDINGEKLAQLRQSRQITRKQLAEQLNISTKSISQYERKGMRPSVEHAHKMETILGESVVQPTDFNTRLQSSLEDFTLNEKLQRRISAYNKELIGTINEIVEDIGFQIFWSKASPFDFVVYQEDKKPEEAGNKYSLIGVTYCNSDLSDVHHCAQRNFLEKVSSNHNGAVIYDEEALEKNKDIVKQEKVPYLVPKDLKKLENPKEFKKLINKRRILQ